MSPPTPPTPAARCAHCGAEFTQHTGPGRPSSYCGTTCQRRSQRRRAKQRALLRDLDAPPGVTERLRLLVAELADSPEADAGSERLVSIAGRLVIEAARLTAARDSVPGRPAAESGGLAVEEAVENLGRVLTTLHRAAGEPTAGTLADATGLPAHAIRAALAGSWAPAWEATASLARALNAHPGLVRPAWERVHYHFLNTRDAFPAAGLPARRTRPTPWTRP
ncbi:hypothetical protein OYE22_01815 [Streptomyces sp. 71268]|uniref:hypothetical protein n=1 Tax=Streptomyces sp. 71268 TaxID=3002640 RepID=UPI0023F8DC32|nr:hypothetical protein [Streptomyces sp. 71268]WEV24071.1 hypothetical protein OYE22_01815 [Streptomyces sp. 71268]